MKKNLFTIPILSLLFIFASCERNDNYVNNPEPKNPDDLYAKTEYNLDMRDFAMAVSKAMNASPEFRKIIKEEANLKFDGDYDVVIKRVMNKPITAPANLSGSSVLRVKGPSFSVGDLLGEFIPATPKENTANNSMQKVSSSPDDIISELTEKYPNLQVSIPVNIENWYEEDYIPTVTFIPAEYEDGITQSVVGYKADGTLVEVDAINEPESEPIVVIGENERVLEPIIDEPIVPFSPLNLISTNTDLGIRLTWSMSNRFSINGYRIYRKGTLDSEFVLIEEINGSLNMAFDDITVIASRSYTYFVTSYNDYYESEPSNFVTIVAQNRPVPNSVLSFSAIQRTKYQIELMWENDYIKPFVSTRIDKWIIGVTNEYNLFNNYSPNVHYCIDNDIQLGKKIIYKIAQVTDSTTSNQKTDFIQVPYRDITQASPVYIKAIRYSCDVGDIESWLKGAPEFAIKTLAVGTDGKTYEYQDEMELSFDNREQKSKNFSGKKIATWFTNRWYDKLTFHAIEKDTEATIKVALNAKTNVKDSIFNVLKPELGIGAEINIRDNSEFCGYGWLDYFEYPTKTINDFVNYGFQMDVSDID